MHISRIFRFSLISLLLVGISVMGGDRVRAQDASPVPEMAASPVATGAESTAPAGVTFIASGLSNPRGFTWGADGALYLAQAGIGGQTLLVQAEGFTLTGGPTSSVDSIVNG